MTNTNEPQALAEVQGTSLEQLSVQDLLKQIATIQEAQSLAMTEGEHYGVIPGTQKPTLLKPGAEKLCLLFRLDPEYEVEGMVQEKDFLSYTMRCTLYHIPSSNRIASGLGACNSRENKYRWRYKNKVCPECGQDTIIKGKEEYGGGWICFKKKGGCGAKWDDGAKEIEGQQVGKIENDNPWELDNTLLKMACKRALVAATLNGTAASDIFTQDLEDIKGHIKIQPVKPAVEVKAEKPKHYDPDDRITTKQRRHIFDTAKAAEMSDDELREAIGSLGYENTEEIPPEGYELVMDRLDEINRDAQGTGSNQWVAKKPYPILD